MVHIHSRRDKPMILTMQPAPCVWAVAPDLSTLLASPSFARLVGIERKALAGLAWSTVLPGNSRPALDWLVDTPQTSPTAILEVRHLEGLHIRVLLRRIHGGPGQDRAVFMVVPLEHRHAETIIDATVWGVDADGFCSRS
jgi:PAS domain-containing protein